MNSSPERIKRIIGKYGGNGDGLISILQDIQAEERYLPEEALRLVSHHLGIPLIQVYGVATFFKAFSLEPEVNIRRVSVWVRPATCEVLRLCWMNCGASSRLNLGRQPRTWRILWTLSTVWGPAP